MNRLDISVPNLPIILEWIQKSDTEKVKWIKLGKAMYTRGKDEIIGFNNEEYQINLENHKKRYDEKINKLNNSIKTERDIREDLIKNHNLKLNSLQNQIEKQTKIHYEKKLSFLEASVLKKNSIINQKDDKLNSIMSNQYQEMQNKKPTINP